MDFQFAPAEERLRVEVKAFLGSSLPAVDQRFHPDVPGLIDVDRREGVQGEGSEGGGDEVTKHDRIS